MSTSQHITTSTSFLNTSTSYLNISTHQHLDFKIAPAQEQS
ncbi:hypothetical protein [Leyella stercorea]|nr:hypothetical protein [Leyella stercorea]